MKLYEIPRKYTRYLSIVVIIYMCFVFFYVIVILMFARVIATCELKGHLLTGLLKRRTV